MLDTAMTSFYSCPFLSFLSQLCPRFAVEDLELRDGKRFAQGHTAPRVSERTLGWVHLAGCSRAAVWPQRLAPSSRSVSRVVTCPMEDAEDEGLPPPGKGDNSRNLLEESA